jgi:hypothetical protein
MYRNCYFASDCIKQPTATVSGGTFCATGTTTLTTTGATGGTFSATPAGLVIDVNTGVIDLGASTPNTYDITYSFGTAPCNRNCYFAGDCISSTDSNSEWRNILRNGNNNLTTTGQQAERLVQHQQDL